MKVISFRGHWMLPMVAALACNLPTAQAQQPITAVELAKPVDAVPYSPSTIEADPVARALVSDKSAIARVEDNFADTAPREIVKERHPNGAIRVEREMIQDAQGNYLRHGLYREYNPAGALIVEGEYDHDQRTGSWRRVHSGGDAPLFQTAPYKDFKAPYLSEAMFNGGVLHGAWTISDSQQLKISEIEFADGERHGKAIWYHPNGMLATQIVYDRGWVHGDVLKWGLDSTIVAKESYQNGRKLAAKLELFPNGNKKRELTYLHATLFMDTPDNWDTASLATFATRGQDERNGPFVVWHPNGQPARQGEYRYNLPVGDITYWFTNGQKQMEGKYRDGKQDGGWTWYHTNGQKAIAGHYAAGAAVGEWTWWQETGKVAKRADLSADKPSAPIAAGLQPSGPDHEANLQPIPVGPITR